MPFTSIGEFRATESPTPAEEALIKACQAGEHCILEDGTLPAQGRPSPERHVRADLLRLLIMGGTPECGLHTFGVELVGAQITEVLDLNFTKTRNSVLLRKCRFSEKPQLAHAEIARLDLQGSHLPGLFAERLNVKGDIFLHNLTSTETVNLSGAKIGGQLNCGNAKFEPLTGDAINLQSIELREYLNLSKLTANGRVILSGAKIGGQLNCEETMLNGKGKDALFAQSLYVAQGFFFRDLKSVIGQINLGAAHISDLYDDAASWRLAKEAPYLNGFAYDRISGNAPLTFAARKDWLARGSRSNNTFHPQPYTQFAKVLREMGHASEARKTLMERDRLLFAESHKTNLDALNAARMRNRSDVGMAWLHYHLLRFWAWFSFTASGYGHAPQRALFWSLGCTAFGAIWFFLAWQVGVMVPNSAIILTSPDWLVAMATSPNHASAAWTNRAPGIHYETFYALPYALDVFVPFLSLGQESAWAATTVGWLGWATRIFTFAYQITGWAITALGIAAITGFVQKNQPDYPPNLNPPLTIPPTP